MAIMCMASGWRYSSRRAETFPAPVAPAGSARAASPSATTASTPLRPLKVRPPSTSPTPSPMSPAAARPASSRSAAAVITDSSTSETPAIRPSSCGSDGIAAVITLIWFPSHIWIVIVPPRRPGGRGVAARRGPPRGSEIPAPRNAATRSAGRRNPGNPGEARGPGVPAQWHLLGADLFAPVSVVAPIDGPVRCPVPPRTPSGPDEHQRPQHPPHLGDLVGVAPPHEADRPAAPPAVPGRDHHVARVFVDVLDIAARQHQRDEPPRVVVGITVGVTLVDPMQIHPEQRGLHQAQPIQIRRGVLTDLTPLHHGPPMATAVLTRRHRRGAVAAVAAADGLGLECSRHHVLCSPVTVPVAFIASIASDVAVMVVGDRAHRRGCMSAAMSPRSNRICPPGVRKQASFPARTHRLIVIGSTAYISAASGTPIRSRSIRPPSRP